MATITTYWSEDDDPEGNVQHIADHGLSKEEVEEVLDAKFEERERSRSSGRPSVFGWTSTGKHIIVVFDIVDEDAPAVYPRSAYEVPPPSQPKKRRKKR